MVLLVIHNANLVINLGDSLNARRKLALMVGVTMVEHAVELDAKKMKKTSMECAIHNARKDIRPMELLCVSKTALLEQPMMVGFAGQKSVRVIGQSCFKACAIVHAQRITHPLGCLQQTVIQTVTRE
jgi:hypothetical protein